jgi:hypothetical protein
MGMYLGLNENKNQHSKMVECSENTAAGTGGCREGAALNAHRERVAFKLSFILTS